MTNYNINEFAYPIDYILMCIKDKIMPNKEHIKNAKNKWLKIKKEKEIINKKNIDFKKQEYAKFAYPIDYIFFCLDKNEIPSRFHILNAFEELKKNK